MPLSLWFITGFSVAGLLFSGYLSVIKLFTDICPVSGGCPYFLGFPACYYGLVLYVALVLLSVAAIKERLAFRKALISIAAVAVLGVLFAGYFSIIELPEFVRQGFAAYTFGAPTCIIGLIFYMFILASAGLGLAHHRAHEG